MGAPERDIINNFLSNLPENMRMFRINAGMGYAGKATKKGEFTIIKNAYPFHAAPEGWPDLTGWTSVIITPDMVGQRIAIFTGIEVKASGKLRQKQELFKNLIERMGGIFKTLNA